MKHAINEFFMIRSMCIHQKYLKNHKIIQQNLLSNIKISSFPAKYVLNLKNKFIFYKKNKLTFHVSKSCLQFIPHVDPLPPIKVNL